MFTIKTYSGTFLCSAHETLLVALERNGYQPEYECRSGYCGNCAIVCKKGSVRYIKKPSAYVHKNQLLPCCCVPTKDLELDIALPDG